MAVLLATSALVHGTAHFQVGELASLQHGVAGKVLAGDDNSIIIKDLNYDGNAQWASPLDGWFSRISFVFTCILLKNILSFTKNI